MRILHVGKYFHPFRGGMENFTLDLCRSQVRAGRRVAVLAHDEIRFRGSRRLEFEGIEVYKAANLGEFVYAPMAPSFGLNFAHAVKSFRPDVIHLHMPNLSAAWLAMRRPRAPLVVHWHSDVVASGFDARLKFFYRFYRPMEKRILSMADAVIATSPDYLETSAALAPFKRKCRVIPLGLDPARLEAAGERPEWMRKERFSSTVLSVGRFTYYKGFEHLVRAAAELEDACFVIAGKGPLKDDIRKLADGLGLSGRIIMPGEIEDHELAWLYENCDAFCLPSIERTEAFGMVLLEAMSHGLPLVTTGVRGSGMNYVNRDGETGLIVPPADHKALAAALKEVLKPGVRKSTADSCRRRFADNFHIEPVRGQFDQLYEEL